MSARRLSKFAFHMSNSVKYAFGAIAGISAGYLLWKWLNDDSGSWVVSGGVSRRKKKQIPGLLNVGNSCFMNALLQCLASCPGFVDWLQRFVEVSGQDENHVYMAEVLLKILKILSGDTEHENCYFDPSELLLDMSGRGWQISSEEQDAHEFYHAAMTTLLEEYHHQVDKFSQPLEIFQVKKLLSLPKVCAGITRIQCDDENQPQQKPGIKDPSFRGTLGCILQCQACGFQNPVRYDGFDSLSLPLQSNLGWGAESSLIDCLRNFTAPEIVRDVECVSCGLAFMQSERGEEEVGQSYEMKMNIETCEKAEASPVTAAKDPPGPTKPVVPLCNNNVEVHKDNVVTSLQDKGDVSPCLKETKCADISTTNENVQNNKTLENESENLKKSRIKKRLPKLDVNSMQGMKNYRGNYFVPDYGNFSIKRPFLRRLCIGKLPECVCIHLQRLVWVRGTPMKKINFVNFPEILDLGPFTEASRLAEKGVKIPLLGTETQTPSISIPSVITKMGPRELHQALLKKRLARGVGVFPTSQNGVATPTKPPLGLQGGSEKATTMLGQSQSNSTKALYRLMSVIVHVGDWSFSGHFLAYRRMMEADDDGETASRWICTSDAIVRKATKEEVFSCPAYMLFYERIKT